jgi:histidinol-phosphate aminotransferase
MPFSMKANPFLKQLKPYQTGKPIEELVRELGFSPEEVVKLASNENPLGPSPKGVEKARESLESSHRYPDAQQFDLRKALAKKHGLSDDCFVAGNGSNDLIEFLIRGFCEPGSNMVVSKSAFAIYKIVGMICGVDVREAQVRGSMEGEGFSNFQFDLNAMAELVDENTRLVFVDNPNNPSGTLVSTDGLDPFVERVSRFKDCLIVMDQAYEEFVDRSDYRTTAEWVNHQENIVVLRTFSKAYGLAGLRVGYAACSPKISFYLNQIRPPFNVSIPAQAAACAALDDDEHVKRTTDLNRRMMDDLEKECARMGIVHPKSYANFVLLDMKRDGKVVYEELLKEGVITRPMAGYGFHRHLRINTGTEKETQKLVEKLEKVYG